MARKTLEDRIAQLEEQTTALKARLSKQERAKDTRRKILLGALLLDQLENASDEMSNRLGDWIQRELPNFLTREADKKLFRDLLPTGRIPNE